MPKSQYSEPRKIRETVVAFRDDMTEAIAKAMVASPYPRRVINDLYEYEEEVYMVGDID